MRLVAPSALVLVIASISLATACQLDYEFVETDGLAGGGSDLVGVGGGSPGSTGGGNGAGGNQPGVGGLGGDSSGGADTGGASSGGASSGGGSTGSGGTAGGSGGASGGSGGASGGGGSGGGSGGTNPILTVTTDDDEEDAGATPSSPGQTGFSLREAILYANLEAGSNEIIFQSAYSISLTSPLPTITDAGRVFGDSGSGTVSIQGAGAGTSAPCLSVDASDVTIETIWIFNCPAEPVSFESGSGNTFTNAFVQNSGAPATFYGDGPVVLFNYWDGADAGAIEVHATDAQILANRVEDPAGTAILVADSADDAFLLANAINSASIGIDLRASDGVRLWHNTIVDASGDGVSLTGTTGVDFRNNIVIGSNQFGVDGSNAQFSLFDYNLYFDNTSGNCSSCTLSANDLTSDPLFGSDYTPQTSSPAIDSGFDLGDDRNITGPGLFNGTGPDRGYIETN